ncbi:MAG: hypothetical protein JWP66_308 [Naasia sp.]|nr:hypothetical protein [Naasia sp.]
MTPSEAALLLGVGPSASLAEVQQAFTRQARLTHPDLLVDATDDDRHEAGLRFDRLHEARAVLLEHLPVVPVAFDYPIRRPRERMGGFGGSILVFLILAAVIVFAVTTMDGYRLDQVQNLRGGVETTVPDPAP